MNLALRILAEALLFEAPSSVLREIDLSGVSWNLPRALRLTHAMT